MKIPCQTLTCSKEDYCCHSCISKTQLDLCIRWRILFPRQIYSRILQKHSFSVGGRKAGPAYGSSSLCPSSGQSGSPDVAYPPPRDTCPPVPARIPSRVPAIPRPHPTPPPPRRTRLPLHPFLRPPGPSRIHPAPVRTVHRLSRG
jgi:hypothetical protein